MKISITGRAFALKSSLTVEQIATLMKYKPEALQLVNEKEDRVVFSLGYKLGHDSLAAFGIQYGSASNDGTGYATFTGVIPADVADVKGYVADAVCKIAENLEALEAQALEAVKTVAESKAKVEANISVVS